MVRRALVTVALLLLAAGGWWLWPATLGGRTTYLVTQGVSMEPRFHSGTSRSSGPPPATPSATPWPTGATTLHTVVLHRIVAVEGGRFRLRGDNNSWLDPDAVPPSDVLGRLVARVPHGGDLLLQVRQPSVLALGSVLVTLGSALLRLPAPPLGGAAARHDVRPPARAAGTSARLAARCALARHDARRLLPSRDHVTACASVAFLSVGVLAWVVPATRVDSHPVAYTQRAALTYRASVPGAPRTRRASW